MSPTSQYLAAALERLRARIADIHKHEIRTDLIHFAGRRGQLITALNQHWDAVRDRAGAPPPDEVITWL